MKIIHFICSGNTFRSRLAEAYFNSKRIEGYKAVSSGVNASNDYNGAITWYAQRILKNNEILKGTSYKWKQTTNELIKSSKIIITMNEATNNKLHREYDVLGKDIIPWSIRDFNEKDILENKDDILKLIKLSEKIYEEIKENVDKLVKDLE